MKLALKNCHLLDGLGTVVENTVVLIEGRQIVKCGRDVSLPTDAKVIDLKGKSVMPGLIDLHNHLVGGDKAPGHGDESKSFRMDEPIAMAAFRTVRAALTTLFAGVTTVREIGSRDLISVQLREAVNDGLITGPRVVSAGAGIAPTGGHGSFWRHEVDGPQEVLKEVRQQIKMGVDWIKLVGVDGPESSGDWKTEQFTFDEIKVAVETAKKQSRGVAAHAIGPAGIKNAVTAGVDTIEHGLFIDDEDCKLMVERGTVLVPTQMVIRTILRNGPKYEMPWVGMFAPYESEIAENFRNAVKCGVTVAMGTDCGGNEATIHGTNAMELELYVNAGMSEMQAIIAATSVPARVLKMNHLIGSVEQGKLADIIVVDGNPLDDITVLQSKVEMVIKDGEIVHRAERETEEHEVLVQAMTN